MKAYKVYFYYDSEYQGYVADALDLPGCVSQGKTLEEADRNIREAMTAYLEVEEEKAFENRSYFLPAESFLKEVALG